jgi:hypothetical protein
MSAAAQRPPPLELVSEPDTAPADTDWLTGEAAAVTDPPPRNPNPGRPKRFSTSGNPSTSSSAP